MNWMTRLLLLGGAFGVCVSVGSGDEKNDRVVAESASPVGKKPLDQAELEESFIRMLNGATFRGTWQMVDEAGLKGKGKLSEPSAEEYAIARVIKVHTDRWLIMARIRYGDKDVSIPVPVRVVWAEDTPIITLDEIDLPGLGKYSARVMVYRNFYSGTWFGDCYGGILSGQIVPTSVEGKEKPVVKGDGKDRAG